METLYLNKYTQGSILQTYHFMSRCPTIPPLFLNRAQLLMLCDASTIRIYRPTDLSTPTKSISISTAACQSASTCAVIAFPKLNVLAINSIGFLDLNDLTLTPATDLNASATEGESLDSIWKGYYFDRTNSVVSEISRSTAGGTTTIVETKSFLQSGLFSIAKLRFLPNNVIVAF